MAVWLTRAGAHGEFEQKFVQESRIYATWDRLNVDVSQMTDKSELLGAMTSRYTDRKPRSLSVSVAQVWPFAHEMKPGDLAILPLKTQPGIQIGEIVGDYHFEPRGPDPYFHWRPVKWIGEAIPRANFGQDVLYTFGAFMTICRVQRNNAEARIRAMYARGWKPESVSDATVGLAATQGAEGEIDSESLDIEELGHDQITRLIAAKFKGHELTRLVEALLQAQGYTTYRSPEGSDGGADILAGLGAMGLGAPRLCVEVKSGDAPIGREAVDKLIGAVSKFGAQGGLFVSWSGFKSNVPNRLLKSPPHALVVRPPEVCRAS